MSFDDKDPEWLKRHKELYGDGEDKAKESVPEWDGGKDNEQPEALRRSAMTEVIEALLLDVQQLQEYYVHRYLPEWQPGDEPWLE